MRSLIGRPWPEGERTWDIMAIKQNAIVIDSI